MKKGDFDEFDVVRSLFVRRQFGASFVGARLRAFALRRCMVRIAIERSSVRSIEHATTPPFFVVRAEVYYTVMSSARI